MKRLYTYLLMALTAVSCVQDPDAPSNLPDAPALSVDETSVTRVSMLVNGSFGKNMTDITAYGVEISETLFEAGKTYKTLTPQVTGISFSLGVTDLKSNNTYFLRAFIGNGYSKMYSSTITQQTPETSVASISDVTVRDNFLVATIEDNGGRSIEEVGFMWGTSNERKALKREKRYVGTLNEDRKTFTLPLGEVGYGTYYVIAYAEDDKDGTGYSRIPFNLEMKDPSQPNSEIWYTSVDGVVVNPTVKDGFGARIVSNTNEDGKGVIAFDGPVTRIPESAFYQSRLVTVTLPSSVEEVGEGAFNQNGSERTLEAFYGKGASQDHLSLVIGGTLSAVARMNEDLDFVIPEGVTKVERGVFEQCHYRSITLPEGLKDTEYGFPSLYHLEAFYGPQTSEDHRCVIIDGELRAIAPEGLTSYVVTDPITGVGNYALYNGFSQIGRLILPESATYIGRQAFGQSQIDTLGLPAHLKEIRDEAFYAMYGLISLTVPEEVESIGSRAFGQAGKDYGGLYNITFLPVTPPVIKEDTFADLQGDGPFYVPAESVEAYKTAQYWSAYADRIQAIPEVLPVSKYLTFTSEGTTTIYLSYNPDYAPVLYYSTDAKNWTKWNYSRLTFTNGSPLYIYGNNPDGFSYGGSNFHNFKAEGDKFAVSGSVMSLINGTEDVTIIPNNYCFFQLFGNCDILTSAPSLPAMVLTEHCYESMFVYCSGLTSVPEVLPATSLAPYCYGHMFFGCTSLTSAPELPAPILADYSYYHMLYGCTSLSYIKCLATDISATYCTLNWTTNVSSLGIFVKAPEMTGWSRGTDAIPGGWVVLDDGAESISASRYLTFTSEGTTSISLSTHSKTPVLYYSIDKTNWSIWDFSEITLTKDVPVYICGDNPNGIGSDESHYCNFVATGDKFSISGDIMSLINKDEALLEIPSKYCFYSLFYQCGLLTSAPELPATILTPYCYNRLFMGCSSLTSTPVLPAMNLESRCYMSMFYDCTSLTEAPELPATDMATACYADMFRGCTSLTKAPVLSSTSLAEYCYAWMFYGCTNLTDAPELPATTVRSNCYYIMFGDCTSLTTAPVLPASKLSDSSYAGMFSGCSNLSYLECLATDISASSCVSSWLMNVSSNGTFVKSPQMNDWPTGASGIPSGWTVEDAQ